MRNMTRKAHVEHLQEQLACAVALLAAAQARIAELEARMLAPNTNFQNTWRCGICGVTTTHGSTHYCSGFRNAI